MRLQFAKLGGSLLTDKTRPRSLERGTLRRLAEETAVSLKLEDDRFLPLVLGHGSGSFGHSAAAGTVLRSTTTLRELAEPSSPEGSEGIDGSDRVGPRGGPAPIEEWTTSPGGRTKQRALATSIATVQDAAATLHREVVSRLVSAGVPCCSLPTSSWLVTRSGRPSRTFVAPLVSALQRGLVPVICGDVVFDEECGAAICSTESAFAALVGALPETMHFARALWLGKTRGVLDDTGRTIARIDETNREEVLGVVAGAAGTDVTGGMRHRVDMLWQLSSEVGESWVLDGTQSGCLSSGLVGTFEAATVVTRAPASV